MQKQNNKKRSTKKTISSPKLVGEEFFVDRKNNVKPHKISVCKKIKQPTIYKKFYALDNLLFRYKLYKTLYFNERKILSYKVRLFKRKLYKHAKLSLKSAKEIKSNKIKLNLKYYFLPTVNIEKELNISNDNIQKGLLEESNVKVKKKKSKTQKKIISLLFLLFNVGIIAGIIIYNASTGNLVSLSVLFASKPYYRYLFLAIGIFIVVNIMDTVKVMLLLKNSTGYYRPYTSYKVNAVGKYYDFVTPLSSGGQPFQVYYLTKSGVPGEKATSVPLAKYIFWQFTFVIIAVIVLLFQSASYIKSNAIVITLAWTGLLGNVLIMSVVLILSLSKKIGPKIILWFLKLGYKLKLVKNYQASFRRVVRFVREYQFCMKDYFKNKWVFILEIVIAVVSTLLYYTIPYCIYLAFNAPNITVSWIDMFARILLCDLAVSFIPLPGGAGAAELSFTAIFASYFPAKTFMWALLIWRFLSYYVFLIQGGIILIYDYIWGNKKLKRNIENNRWPDKGPKYRTSFKIKK